MRKYFYFRTEADEDNDDDIATSVMMKVEDLVAMYPTSNTALTLTFNPMLSHQSDDAGAINTDTILRNMSPNQHAEVRKAIARSANATAPQYNDGVIVVAGQATTDYDGTTKSAVYLDGNITSCGAIAIAAVYS